MLVKEMVRQNVATSPIFPNNMPYESLPEYESRDTDPLLCGIRVDDAGAGYKSFHEEGKMRGFHVARWNERKHVRVRENIFSFRSFILVLYELPGTSKHTDWEGMRDVFKSQAPNPKISHG